MNEFSKIASDTEKLLEKLYLSVSILALISIISFCTIIFIFIGFSSFSVMQSIGSILFVLLIASVYLFFRKKYIYYQLSNKLSECNIISSQENDSTDIANTGSSQDHSEDSSDNTKTSRVHDQFMDYLNHHLTNYELTQTLFKAFSSSGKTSKKD